MKCLRAITPLTPHASGINYLLLIGFKFVSIYLSLPQIFSLNSIKSDKKSAIIRIRSCDLLCFKPTSYQSHQVANSRQDFYIDPNSNSCFRLAEFGQINESSPLFRENVLNLVRKLLTNFSLPFLHLIKIVHQPPPKGPEETQGFPDSSVMTKLVSK